METCSCRTLWACTHGNICKKQWLIRACVCNKQTAFTILRYFVVVTIWFRVFSGIASCCTCQTVVFWELLGADKLETTKVKLSHVLCCPVTMFDSHGWNIHHFTSLENKIPQFFAHPLWTGMQANAGFILFKLIYVFSFVFNCLNTNAFTSAFIPVFSWTVTFDLNIFDAKLHKSILKLV